MLYLSCKIFWILQVVGVWPFRRVGWLYVKLILVGNDLFAADLNFAISCFCCSAISCPNNMKHNCGSQKCCSKCLLQSRKPKLHLFGFCGFVVHDKSNEWSLDLTHSLLRDSGFSSSVCTVSSAAFLTVLTVHAQRRRQLEAAGRTNPNLQFLK